LSEIATSPQSLGATHQPGAEQERAVRAIKLNTLFKELFDQMGFRRVSESAEEVRYEFDVPAAPIVMATHVRNKSADALIGA
jgi:hypothetical protein